MVKKGDAYARILDKELLTRGYTKENIKSKITKEDKAYFKELRQQNLLWFSKAEALGWTEETPQQRAVYLKSIEEEKKRREQQQSSLNNVRYYDLLPARFVGRDKVKVEDDPKAYYQINPYQFTNNNPVHNVDPDGEKGVAVMSGATYKIKNNFKYYEVNVYPNLTMKDYYATKASGKFETFKPKATVYLSRDALGAKMHPNDALNYGGYPDNSKFGGKREAPNKTYVMWPGDDAHINISDRWGNTSVQGPDGERTGLQIHKYTPEFSLGCLTSGEGKNDAPKTMQTLYQTLPDIKNQKDPAYLIKQPVK